MDGNESFHARPPTSREDTQPVEPHCTIEHRKLSIPRGLPYECRHLAGECEYPAIESRIEGDVAIVDSVDGPDDRSRPWSISLLSFWKRIIFLYPFIKNFIKFLKHVGVEFWPSDFEH